MLKRSMLIASLLFLLVACSPSKPIPTAQPSIEAQPVVANPSPVPTKTSLPATATLIPSPTAITSPTATLPPAGYGPDNFPKDVNPLTGIKVADVKILDRRPLGIKVNIYPRGTTRPPFGLSFADIVYEYYHNDGASRYHAIFYGEDAKEVGPIRSGRLLDDSLIRMYKSIFIFGGASVEIESRFENADYAKRMIIGGYDNLPCPPTKENPLCTFEPNGRHNLIGDTSLIRQYAATTGIDSTRQNLNGMYFQTNAPSGGKPGKQVYTRYSWDMYNRWDYNATTGRYMLFGDAASDENGGGEKYDPMIDRVTNQQIGTDNVVELIVPDEYAQRPPNEIVDILLSGTGTAYAFRDGQVYQVTWNRPTVDSVLYLTNPDGTRFPFKPGKTWFEVMNKESTIKEENGAYRFTYFIRR